MHKRIRLFQSFPTIRDSPIFDFLKFVAAPVLSDLACLMCEFEKEKSTSRLPSAMLHLEQQRAAAETGGLVASSFSHSLFVISD